MMKQWMRDLIYGVVIVLFAIGNIIYANTLPAGSIKLVMAQAGTYLKLVMILLGILGICLIVRAWGNRSSEKECEALFNVATVGTVVGLALYLFLMDKLGFTISSVLFVFLMITFYSHEQTPELFKDKGKLAKHMLGYLLCAVIVTGFCYFLFGKVLTVVLPQFTLF